MADFRHSLPGGDALMKINGDVVSKGLLMSAVFASLFILLSCLDGSPCSDSHLHSWFDNGLVYLLEPHVIVECLYVLLPET